jgi:hypothetical protein
MLPVPEGCVLDADLAGGNHPNGDETTGNDGWAAFSGTSAAAPQVAGVCALIKQACGKLTPAEIRDILMQTARDVTTGTNHPNFGNAAVAGPDTATGNGLVDAHKAVLVAKVRCIAAPITPFLPFVGPFPPIQPVVPFRPVQPSIPIRPVLPFRPLFPLQPLQPIQPALPIQPAFPIQPALPLQPALPIQPALPLQPFAPLRPIQPFVGPGPGPGPLSGEDLEAIERMIIESEDPDL